MEFYKHLLVTLIFAGGLFVSGVLIDMDHKGTWKDKWKCAVTEKNCDNLERGVLHKPIVIFSLIALFLGLGLGLLLHFLMDSGIKLV
jgi:hypothetical protein